MFRIERNENQEDLNHEVYTVYKKNLVNGDYELWELISSTEESPILMKNVTVQMLSEKCEFFCSAYRNICEFSLDTIKSASKQRNQLVYSIPYRICTYINGMPNLEGLEQFQAQYLSIQGVVKHTFNNY